MAQPEIIKDMFLKAETSYTNTLNTNIIPGSYALSNYTDSSSPLSGVYGTLIQGAGIYRPQIILGNVSNSNINRMFIRRYITNSNSYTPWDELITSRNYASFLDERYALKTSSAVTSAIIYRITEV